MINYNIYDRPISVYLASQVYKTLVFRRCLQKTYIFLPGEIRSYSGSLALLVNLLYKMIILLVWDQQNYLWSGIIFQFWQEGNVH
jgi:hypothetical protein